MSEEIANEKPGNCQSPEPTIKKIAVVGDVNQYVLSYEDTEISRSFGGSLFLARLIKRTLGEQIEIKTYENNLQETSEQTIRDTGYPEIKWELKYFRQDNRSVLRYKNHEPISPSISTNHPKLNLEKNEKFDIIVIEDSGRETENSFCNRKIDGQPEYKYILDHLSKPQEDTDNEQTIDNKRYAFPQVILLINKKLPNFQKDGFWKYVKDKYGDKTLAIIDANVLRKEGLKISKGISWELTAQDFLAELYTDPKLQQLGNFQHLVVRFGVTGVIHIVRIDRQAPEAPKCQQFRRVHRLFFDPNAKKYGLYRDTSTEGSVSGNQTILATSIIQEIVNYVNSKKYNCLYSYAIAERIGDSIRKSIRRCQKHFDEGLGCDTEKVRELVQQGGVRTEIFDNNLEFDRIADERIPVGNPSWSILNQSAEYNLLDVAKDIVLQGINSTLNNPNSGKERVIWTPIVQFKNLTVIDRREIETYRTVHRLFSNIVKSPTERPLSIAVFGPPGSGKSFVVKQLVNSVSSDKEIDIKSSNLAQFSDPKKLEDFIDDIKETIKADRIPLVFFDEFDSDLNGNELGWLKYFLPYMEDWEYQPPSGKGNPIFVFAGGTSHNYRDFTREDSSISEQKRADFVMKKGPDFVSRLRGHINILGPNPVNQYDQSYVIRRALLLRYLLLDRLSENKKLENESLQGKVSLAIVTAMLKVSSFKHGSRSMRAIINMCDNDDTAQNTIFVSAIPPASQLNMHVDAKEFIELLEDAKKSPRLAEE